MERLGKSVGSARQKLPRATFAYAIVTAAYALSFAILSAVSAQALDPLAIGDVEAASEPAVSDPLLDADGNAPEDLFAAASQDLKAGRLDDAQRLFEMLVARTPDSPLAAKARQQLALLYARPLSEPVAAVAETSPTQSDATAPPANRSAAQRPTAARAVGERVEDSFIIEAGDRVFFAAGSAELGSRARAVLIAQARWLKRRPEFDAVVEGHADDSPLTDAQHEELSEARADAVRRRLIEEGVPAARVRIASWGRDNPITRCVDPDCAAQNRRAVTVLTPNSGSLGHAPLGKAGFFAGGQVAPVR